MNQSDPRVKRTRKLIFDAFASLLEEKGFHAVNVQDIATRATVNRATFYAHFVDKFDLLDHVVSDWFHGILSHRKLSGTTYTAENLQRLIVTVLDAVAEFHGHCLPPHQDVDSSIELRLQRELSEFLFAWFQERASAGETNRVSAATAASVTSWAILGAAIDWSKDTAASTSEERARHIALLVTRGVAPVPRRTAALPKSDGPLRAPITAESIRPELGP